MSETAKLAARRLTQHDFMSVRMNISTGFAPGSSFLNAPSRSVVLLRPMSAALVRVEGFAAVERLAAAGEVLVRVRFGQVRFSVRFGTVLVEFSLRFEGSSATRELGCHVDRESRRRRSA